MSPEPKVPRSQGRNCSLIQDLLVQSGNQRGLKLPKITRGWGLLPASLGHTPDLTVALPLPFVVIFGVSRGLTWDLLRKVQKPAESAAVGCPGQNGKDCIPR